MHIYRPEIFAHARARASAWYAEMQIGARVVNNISLILARLN